VNRALVDILACPSCKGSLRLESAECEATKIVTGSLACGGCGVEFPIRAGVPRFVTDHPADSSFGYQWNTFRREQLDSATGVSLSAARLWSETGWRAADMVDRRVLDVGCGAGRFLEVMARTGCRLVGVDVSSAIDAAAATIQQFDNTDLVQADVFRLPFRDGVFDDCYFIGVAQHTPDPERAIRALPRLLKPEGRLAVSAYERRRWTLWNGKYLLRPLTRRMNKRLLLGLIRATMPVLFPLSELLFRIPVAGKVFAFAIPVANYVHMQDLGWRQRYRLAVLDTFDRLAPDFDLPLSEEEMVSAMHASGIEAVRRQTPHGLNVVGVRAAR